MIFNKEIIKHESNLNINFNFLNEEFQSTNYLEMYMESSLNFLDIFHNIKEELIIFNHFAVKDNFSLEILHEEEQKFFERVKDFLKNLWERIKEIFLKFQANISRLWTKNAEWIKKYEERILNADLKNFKYNIYPYWNGINHIMAVKVPEFNKNNQGLIESLKNEQTFIEENWSKYKPINNNNFIDTLKFYFRGASDPKEISGLELKSRLKGIIEYCKNADDIIKNIKDDITKIERSIKQAERDTSSASAGSMQDQEKKSESFFSLSEADIPDAKEVKKHQKEMEEKNKQLKDSNNEERKETTEEVKKMKENIKKDTTVNNKDENKKETPRIKNKILDRYVLYVRVCQQVLGAKMSILEERYNNYMKMLRHIVDMEIGQKTPDEDRESVSNEVNKKLKKIEDITEKEKNIDTMIEKIKKEYESNQDKFKNKYEKDEYRSKTRKIIDTVLGREGIKKADMQKLISFANVIERLNKEKSGLVNSKKELEGNSNELA